MKRKFRKEHIRTVAFSY